MREFRAIREADIILNGITVVAGENGSGKSTLSQFLYYVFKVSNEYELLISQELKTQLREVHSFLRDIGLEMSVEGRKIEYKKLIPTDMKLPFTVDGEEKWVETIDAVFGAYIFSDKEKKEFRKITTRRLYRLMSILADILDFDDKKEDTTELSNLSMVELLRQLKDYVHKCFAEANRKVEERPAGQLKNMLKKAFSTHTLPERYEVLEFGVPIISEKNRIERVHSIRQVAYIDTPMLLGVSSNKYSYWNDTNAFLKKGGPDRSDNFIYSVISSQIVGGEAYYENYGDNSLFGNRFIYRRDDGSEFDLLDCATGVKSFAMLQILLRNGFLNKYTLLIIDEPESHLHPQWIIEYARLLVLLNKHVGVKFFIASHNPDMVSAIKYISEKEEVDNNLNFYIATPTGNKHSYEYLHLGTNIEPIFESFNIALDRINLYGSKPEDSTDEIL